MIINPHLPISGRLLSSGPLLLFDLTKLATLFNYSVPTEFRLYGAFTSIQVCNSHASFCIGLSKF
jgi:hypothetical protein